MGRRRRTVREGQCLPDPSRPPSPKYFGDTQRTIILDDTRAQHITVLKYSSQAIAAIHFPLIPLIPRIPVSAAKYSPLDIFRSSQRLIERFKLVGLSVSMRGIGRDLKALESLEGIQCH